MLRVILTGSPGPIFCFLAPGRLRHDNPLSQSSKKTYYDSILMTKTRKNLIKTFHIFIK